MRVEVRDGICSSSFYDLGSRYDSLPGCPQPGRSTLLRTGLQSKMLALNNMGEVSGSSGGGGRNCGKEWEIWRPVKVGNGVDLIDLTQALRRRVLRTKIEKKKK